MNCVTLGLKVRLYPDKNMEAKINQNIGNAGFTWNKLLENYQNTYKIFKQHGYNKLKCNMTTFNTMLKILKQEHDFLSLIESSSLQQVFRDLLQGFNNFFKRNTCYPRFESKKNNKQSFRIQNNHNIKIQDNIIILPKLGGVHYRTSKKYKEKLKTVKINNVSIKKDNGKYYPIFNIETDVEDYPKTDDAVGIDLGMRTLATLSNEEKITNLNVNRELKMIKKYQKQLSRKKHNSKRYKKTLKKILEMVRPKKQQNTQLLPRKNHRNHQKIRHNHTRRPKHKRNVSKPIFKWQITKYQFIQICRNAKIQSRNMRQKNHTSQPMVPIKQKMQQLRIPQHRPKNRPNTMDMPQLQHNT